MSKQSIWLIWGVLSTRGALCDAGAERAGGTVRFGELGKARAGEVLTVTGRS